jgi:DNA-directed RNA polymerase II subunit RPB7
LGASLPALLQETLLAQVEGHCTGRHGYIIAVLGHERHGHGIVQDGSETGAVEFTIKYRAIVLKPFKNEVVDAVVVTVNKMGFFAEVGPLNIFISNHLIPTDFKFEPNSMPPCYISEEQVNTKWHNNMIIINSLFCFRVSVLLLVIWSELKLSELV